jgi:hypothetical protein
MHMSYAVAKTYDHKGAYEQAMAWFDRANELAYESYPACKTFDPAFLAKREKEIPEIYSPALFDRLNGTGSQSALPIFIVGMVRSGTTLLDRILSSHPAIQSAGEQPFWNAEADRLRGDFEKSLDASLAEAYLALLQDAAPGGERIVDKMPLNFAHLGLIHLAFPQAKIVHIRRDPVDTCLSIYQTFFAGGPFFAYNRRNIVEFYRSYLRQMEHWRAVLPANCFFEVDYESFVANRETTTRATIEFLGLPWNDACLNPEKAPGVVATPSKWQARQPVYATSVQKWRRYEPWLGEFSELISVDE